MVRRALLLVALAALFVIIMRYWTPTPPKLGIQGQSLAPCPDSPNCVSSLATDALHAMAPWQLHETPEVAVQRLATIVSQMPRARIVEQTNGYLRAEFRSLLFSFVDDVEFLVDQPQGVIHFRSAARLGYSDLGANRQRMLEIARQLEQSQATEAVQ